MKQIKKAVIPAAGLGTRFLPATKSIPKEMLPLFDAPTILFVVEEAIQAGIEDIVLITGRNKSSIEDFFDVSYELEDKLAGTDKEPLLSRVHAVRDKANIISIRQKKALGLGHAVYCSQPIVGDEPFAVLLGDEVTLSDTPQENVTFQLCKTVAQTGRSSVLVMEVAEKDVTKYGIADVKGDAPIYQVNGFVEKPSIETAPSRLALPGRYAFTAEIFDLLRNAKPGKNGEIQLTDSMNVLAQSSGVNACLFPSRRYDAGDRLGYMQLSIVQALNDSEVGPGLRQWLTETVGVK